MNWLSGHSLYCHFRGCSVSAARNLWSWSLKYRCTANGQNKETRSVRNKQIQKAISRTETQYTKNVLLTLREGCSKYTHVSVFALSFNRGRVPNNILLQIFLVNFSYTICRGLAHFLSVYPTRYECFPVSFTEHNTEFSNFLFATLTEESHETYLVWGI